MSGMVCSANFTQPRAAACKLRQVLVLQLALDELFGFFHHGQVGRETRVVHIVKPHAFHGGDHFTRQFHACRNAEHLADRNPDGRGDLGDHLLFLIANRLPDLIDFAADRQSPHRTDRRALAAVDALPFAQALAKGRHNRRLMPAIGKVDRADALNLRTESHAVAAQRALVRIAHHRPAGLVDCLGLMHPLEAHLGDPQGDVPDPAACNCRSWGRWCIPDRDWPAAVRSSPCAARAIPASAS